MVMCLGQGIDLHMAELMPLPLTTGYLGISCSSKSRQVLAFSVKWSCMCVRVSVSNYP